MTKIVYALKVFLGFFQKSYPKREFFNVTFLEISNFSNIYISRNLPNSSKLAGVNGAKFSRMDQVKFVEDSL